jgi:hypothetical protein
MTPAHKTALAQLAHLTVLLWDRVPARTLWSAHVHQTQGEPHLALEQLAAAVEYSKNPIPLHELEVELFESLWTFFHAHVPDTFAKLVECRPGTRCVMHGYYDDPNLPNLERDSFSSSDL